MASFRGEVGGGEFASDVRVVLLLGGANVSIADRVSFLSPRRVNSRNAFTNVPVSPNAGLERALNAKRK